MLLAPASGETLSLDGRERSVGARGAGAAAAAAAVVYFPPSLAPRPPVVEFLGVWAPRQPPAPQMGGDRLVTLGDFSAAFSIQNTVLHTLHDWFLV